MNVEIEVNDYAIRQIVPEGTDLEQIATGFGFTEGPVWCGDYLLFSDLRHNRIVRLDMRSYGSEVTTFRTPSGFSNGNTLDNCGRLLTCEHSGRRVIRTEVDGSISVIADRYQGKRLNSPNDIVVRSDGSVYFTDPTFGLGIPPKWMEAPCKGVYRIAPDGELALLVDDFDMCNGLAFSPDESILYINDSFRSHIRAFDVAEDGSISNGREFLELKGKEPGGPDGMKVDREGNVYCTGPGGIWIAAQDVKYLGRIMMPEQPANFAWGDSDWQTLYITARTSIFRLRLSILGIPVARSALNI